MLIGFAGANPSRITGNDSMLSDSPMQPQGRGFYFCVCPSHCVTPLPAVHQAQIFRFLLSFLSLQPPVGILSG